MMETRTNSALVSPHGGPYRGPAAMVLFMVWIASVLRTVAGLVTHEIFGAEATLALFMAVLVPWLFLHDVRREAR